MAKGPEHGRWERPTFNAAGKLPTREYRLRDITLREGEQAADVALSVEEKVALGHELDAAGLPQIQCGYAVQDSRLVRRLKEEGCKAALELICVGYSPNWESQVRDAVESQADIVHFLFRSDDLHLADLGVDRLEALRRVGRIASTARSAGAKSISFGPSFASRADPGFLVEVVGEAIRGGATQAVISDSTGSMHPEGFAALVGHVRGHLDSADETKAAQLAVHCHDDFGLAVANSLAGLRAGASIVECSVGGFGERAGNAPTEEVAAALGLLYGVDTGIDIRALVAATKRLYETCRLAIPPLKPLAGPNVFTQKLDIHVMTTRKSPWLHEPFDPAEIGATRRLAVGKRSGPVAVKEKAKELALELPDARVPEVVAMVNAYADAHKRALSDDEFKQIVGTG